MSSLHEQTRKRQKLIFGHSFRSLRWQLLLRTLLPMGLLVITFAIVGQIGYTQVTESLAKSRDTEVAKVEAARVGDQLQDAARSLRQVASSAAVTNTVVTELERILKDEPLSQHFDFVQVLAPDGSVRASSDGKTGDKMLVPASFDYVKGAELPMKIAMGSLNGRDAIVFTQQIPSSDGSFLGAVEGAVALGSRKLGLPFRDASVGANSQSSPASASSFSYLTTVDGMILWHPDAAKVGELTKIIPAADAEHVQPGAKIISIDGERSIVGYAPLNLGQLLISAKADPQLLQWLVVTQHKWADVVRLVNQILFLLLVLAFAMFMFTVLLVVRNAAGTLALPVAKLVNAAQMLSAGKLKHRLDLIDISGPLEIEELARQFNLMAEQLHTSYTDLEQKVADRTRELAATNVELARKLRESETTQVIAANLAGTSSLEEILQVIASSASEAMDTEGSVVYLPSDHYPGELEAAVVYNTPSVAVGARIDIDSSLTGLTYKTGQPQISASVTTDARVDQDTATKAGAKSVLSAPLVSRGQVIGVINTRNKRWGDFTEDDMRLLSLLANQAAVGVERARLYNEARKQVATLATINELSLSVTASRSVTDTLTGGMEHIGKLLGASGAVVFLYNEKNRALEYAASYNMHPVHQALVSKDTIYVDRKYERPIAVLDAYHTQEPSILRDMFNEDYIRRWRVALQDNPAGNLLKPEDLEMLNVRSLIALPLTVHDKRLGSMTLYFAQPQPLGFKAAELQQFRSFANILALAVYNTQLVAQTSKLATVEERARLARELHDSVTQSLFSLNLTLRAARRNMAGNAAKAERLFDDVQDLAQGALAEMRALIFELRPQALVNEGLVSALQKHADAVRARSGLQVNLQVLGDRRLPIETEEALYQIAREALHNVVKHAYAKQAWVDLDLEGSEVRMAIRDDGRGFDVGQLQRDGGSHIGTSTMHERSEAISGNLELKSYPGGGTEVFISVPSARDGSEGSGTGDQGSEITEEESEIRDENPVGSR